MVPIWKVPYSFDQGGNRGGEYDEGTPTELDQEYRPHPSRMYTSSIAVQPPPSFKPIPVMHGSDVVPKPIPSNVPHKPFKDASVFENVDIHAVEVGTNIWFREFSCTSLLPCHIEHDYYIHWKYTVAYNYSVLLACIYSPSLALKKTHTCIHTNFEISSMSILLCFFYIVFMDHLKRVGTRCNDR